MHDQPKASPNIHTSKDNKVPIPTPEASPPQVQKPPVRTRSGRLVRKPAYLKDYEHLFVDISNLLVMNYGQ